MTFVKTWEMLEKSGNTPYVFFLHTKSARFERLSNGRQKMLFAYKNSSNKKSYLYVNSTFSNVIDVKTMLCAFWEAMTSLQTICYLIGDIPCDNIWKYNNLSIIPNFIIFFYNSRKKEKCCKSGKSSFNF